MSPGKLYLEIFIEKSGETAAYANFANLCELWHSQLNLAPVTVFALGDLRGKGERSKGRRGLEQEKRARERGISAADGRGWSWGGYRKKSSGLGLEGGYQKGRFQGGGTRHTHRHTDIYIYINTYI